MAMMSTIRKRRGGRGLYHKVGTQQSVEHKRRLLPEYLEYDEVQAVLRHAVDARARLVMLVQWRAGLRVSEALAITTGDLSLDSERPTLRVRQGKFGKARVVPVHSELADAFRTAMAYGRHGKDYHLVDAHRSTVWRWVRAAVKKAEAIGVVPPGRRVGTHTLRHSAARHWLASGVPINVVSRWLGHASLQNTLVYLEVLPDPLGDMERVP